WFLCDRSACYRALHSFPTRRSSDLLYRWVSPYSCQSVLWFRRQRPTFLTSRITEQRGRRRTTPGPPFKRPSTPAPKLAAASSTRSEEHTSELQSLAYLVCRLLLEKK